MKYIKIHLATLFFFISTLANAQFITTWKTDNLGSSNNNQITIPTIGAGYNYNVDWGDGTNDTGITGNITHSYATIGTYTVEITGTFPRIYFNAGGFFGSNTDYGKILTIEQWGTNAWASMANAFSGCTNLRVNASDTPNLSAVTDMSYMFRECEALNDNLNGWNVSNTTNMIGLFREASSFNQPLNGWDVSNVQLMDELFRGASNFNQPLNLWDVGQVTSMVELFFIASTFNQDIGMWNVSNVANMRLMFAGASVFNQNISFKPGGANDGNDAWNTANVTNMNQMLAGTEDFDQPIGNWNTSNLNDLGAMFASAHSFNQNITGWDLTNVTSLRGLFRDATAFNQDLSAWNTTIGSMVNLSQMFDGATAFNQDLSGWDVSNVTDMGNMFSNSTFNPNISGWDVSSVGSFNGMFENNTAFNQDISEWVVSSATDMRVMFSGAYSFNQNLGGWDVSNITSNSMASMLNNSGLSVDNYDNLLIGWAAQAVNPNVSLGASGLYYCAGEGARAQLVTQGWFITDAGTGCIAVFKGNDTTGSQIFNTQPEVIDFGSINMGGTKSLSFTIENRLATDITNFNVSISGVAFSATSPSTTITPGNPLVITIDFSASMANVFNETVTFTYNPIAGLSNTFTFDITGVVTAGSEPEIAVFEGNTTAGNVIVDSGNLSLPDAIKGTNATTQITIENKGSDTLKISSFSLPTGSKFSIAPNTATNLPVDSTLTYTITLDATTAGFFTDELVINNNDSTEPTFTINLAGTILGPDINVFDGPNIYSDPPIYVGQGYSIDFKSALVGTNITRQVAIANYGLADLTISNIQVNAPFSVSVSNLTIPAMIDNTPHVDTIEIVLSGIVPGSFNEVITIVNDDDSKPNFDFFLVGNIIDPDEPKVYWSDNNEINRSNLEGSSFQQYHTETSYQPRGVEVDTLNQIIYWSNNWGQIKKGKIDATGLVDVNDFINDGIDAPRMMAGLALDVAGDNIYWISVYDNIIKTASLSELDPANVTTTNIVTGLSNPIGIAVDPIGGFLYYTENIIDTSTGDNIASLHQVNIDGTNDNILSTQTLTGQQFTYNDVVIDVVANKIYWTASNNDIFNPNGNIYVGDLADVSGTINSITVANNLPFGIDVDVKNNKIYWTDNAEYMNFPPSTINSSDVDGSNKIVLQSDFPNLNYPLYIALGVSQPAAGCQDPPTADAGANQTVCSTDIISLSGIIGGGANANNWTTSGDGTFGDVNLKNTTYNLGTNDRSLGSVTLTLISSAPNCPNASDPMEVTINLPISVINQSDTINITESAIIDVFNGGFVNSGDVITTTLSTQPQKGSATINTDGTIQYTASTGNVGIDTFDFQIENQCNQTASATVTITIPNTPPSFNDGNATTIPGVPITINITDLITDLNGNIDLSSIQIIQQPASGAPATLDASNNLVVDYTGMIFFGVDEVVIEVCDADGACTTASIFINVEALPVVAFNALSPNGDGKHDFLEFQYIEAYPNNTVKVFNRWGDIVFEIEGYNNNDNIFTGVSNIGGSKELPTGTYYYTVTYLYPSGITQTLNGFFELRR